MAALIELERAYLKISANPTFREELDLLWQTTGAPTPMYYALPLSEHLGDPDLSSGDLVHPGAIDQHTLVRIVARWMGRRRSSP